MWTSDEGIELCRNVSQPHIHSGCTFVDNGIDLTLCHLGRDGIAFDGNIDSKTVIIIEIKTWGVFRLWYLDASTCPF